MATTNGVSASDEEQSNSASDVMEGGESDESSSNAPPEKMKGNKPNPLRRWAEET